MDEIKNWDSLSLSEKLKFIKYAVDLGVPDLDSIRSAYGELYLNRFDLGGPETVTDDLDESYHQANLEEDANYQPVLNLDSDLDLVDHERVKRRNNLNTL